MKNIRFLLSIPFMYLACAMAWMSNTIVGYEQIEFYWVERQEMT
jgi:hypothetical protein